jgi:hypothetical protein
MLLLLLVLFVCAPVNGQATVLGVGTTCAGPLDAESCGIPAGGGGDSCTCTLAGDVTGPLTANTYVGGTPLNTAGEVVRRDSAGAFAAGSISSHNPLATDSAFVAMLTADSVPRLNIGQAGALSFSDGSNPADVSISKTDINTLSVSGDLNIDGSVTDPTTETVGNTFTTTMSPPTTASASLTATRVVLLTGNDNAFTRDLIATSSEIQLSGSGDLATPSAIFAGVRVISNRPSTHGLLTVAVNTAGINYTVGDEVQVTGFTTVAGVVTVTSVDGFGGVTGVSITAPGVGYATPPLTGQATTGGTGSGLTIDVVERGSTGYGGASGTSVAAIRIRAFSAAGTNSTPVVGTLRGVDILDSDVGTGPATISTQVGVNINAQTKGSSTTGGIDIKAQTGGAATTNFGLRIGIPSGGTNNYAIQIAGTPTTAAGGITWGTDVNLYRSAVGRLQTDTDMYARRFIFTGTGIPTVAAGPGAGTGATVTVVSGNDHLMQIKVVTGTAPTANAAVFTVTFSSSLGTGNLPYVTVGARSATAAAVPLYVFSESVLAFTASIAGATPLTASTTYIWNVRAL